MTNYWVGYGPATISNCRISATTGTAGLAYAANSHDLTFQNCRFSGKLPNRGQSPGNIVEISVENYGFTWMAPIWRTSLSGYGRP